MVSTAGGAPARAARTVTNGGPKTKITSSRTDSSEYAVRSSGCPARTVDQRARTSEPMFGYVAPATTATGNRVQEGACAVASHTSSRIARLEAATCGGTARAWPYRSISRDSRGWISAPARANDADTAPARL